MVNTLRLKARIVECNETIGSVAIKMNLSNFTLSRKIRNLTSFTLNEAQKLQEILKIPDEEYVRYFFCK